MSARDALAQVKRDMATRTDGDAPSREVLIAAETIVIEHAPRLVEVVEAVSDLADSIQRARFMRVEMSTAEIHTRLTGALNKLEGR